MVHGNLPAECDMQTPMEDHQYAICTRRVFKIEGHGARKSPGRIRHAGPHGKQKVKVLHESRTQNRSAMVPGSLPADTHADPNGRPKVDVFHETSVQNGGAMVPGRLTAECDMQTPMGDQKRAFDRGLQDGGAMVLRDLPAECDMQTPMGDQQ